MTRRWLLVSYLMLLVVLMAGSVARRVGDGGEYIEMASQIAAFEAPTVYAHFWLYPALAAPFVALADGLRLPAVYGFPVLNLILLGGAFWLVTARFNWALAFALFSGPIIWWVDKPHTEVLTFALLSVAVVLLDEAPWWSLVALGTAAAQNLAVAPLVPLAAVVAAWRRTSLLRARRFWIALAASVALVAVNVVYYQWMAGRIVILTSTLQGVPNVDEIGTVLLDLNVGLGPAFPILALLVAIGLVVLIRRPVAGWPIRELAFSAGATLLFLAAFSQTLNYNHGGTFGMSRYGIWFVPLAIPFLRPLDVSQASPRRWTVVVALVSCVWSAFAFHPNHPEDGYVVPTRLARFVWTRFPGLSNPIPEVFVERLRETEIEWYVPTRTERCEKILLTGRPDFSMWPMPCPPQPVPEACRPPGAFCYANFNRRDYSFARVRPPSYLNYKFDRAYAWPLEVERVVGDELRALRWWQLDPVDFSGRGSVVEVTGGLRRMLGWEGEDRLFLYMEQPEDESAVPTITLRVPAPMSGRFVDAETGVAAGQVTCDPAAPAPIAVPQGHRYLMLVLLAPPA